MTEDNARANAAIRAAARDAPASLKRGELEQAAQAGHPEPAPASGGWLRDAIDEAKADRASRKTITTKGGS